MGKVILPCPKKGCIMSRYYRKFYNNEPREIIAKFDSVCKDTGKVIKKGEKCLYFPASKAVVTLDSKSAQDYFSMLFDERVLS